MKWIIRLFFRTIRRIIGPIMLLIDKLTTPKGVTRPPEVQHKLDQTTQQLSLYQFKTCPFCMKVRREIKRLSLNIEVYDAQHNQVNRERLRNDGGKIKVPCLHIRQKDGNDTWLYESNEVIQYLRKLAA